MKPIFPNNYFGYYLLFGLLFRQFQINFIEFGPIRSKSNKNQIDYICN